MSRNLYAVLKPNPRKITSDLLDATEAEGLLTQLHATDFSLSSKSEVTQNLSPFIDKFRAVVTVPKGELETAPVRLQGRIIKISIGNPDQLETALGALNRVGGIAQVARTISALAL